MNDPSWTECRRAILAQLRPDDVLLVPRGDWEAFPCEVRFYDTLIDVADETVLMLHKGRIPGMRQEALAAVVADWQCIHANSVFAVFSRARRRWLDVRHTPRGRYLRRVRQHLAAPRLRKLDRTVFYIHLPKAGGTAVWQALSTALPSSIYYGELTTFAARPPRIGDHDLVGLHFSPAMIRDRVRPGDLVVGLLRDPIQRFFSGVVHSRRPGEDVAQLGPSQRAMRAMSVSDFLDTPFGRHEAQLQLRLLGAGDPCDAGEAILDRALAFLDRPETFFAPASQSAAFTTELLAQLGAEPTLPPWLNAGEPASYGRYAQEFEAAMPRLMAMTVYERRLFDAVQEGRGASAAV